MKIKRDGREYELTTAELTEAYFEQLSNYDIQDCKNGIQTIIDDDIDERTYVVAAKRVLHDEDLLAECAAKMRRNIDKYDMDWSYARDEAVRSVVSQVQSELL